MEQPHELLVVLARRGVGEHVALEERVAFDPTVGTES